MPLGPPGGIRPSACPRSPRCRATFRPHGASWCVCTHDGGRRACEGEPGGSSSGWCGTGPHHPDGLGSSRRRRAGHDARLDGDAPRPRLGAALLGDVHDRGAAGDREPLLRRRAPTQADDPCRAGFLPRGDPLRRQRRRHAHRLHELHRRLVRAPRPRQGQRVGRRYHLGGGPVPGGRRVLRRVQARRLAAREPVAPPPVDLQRPVGAGEHGGRLLAEVPDLPQRAVEEVRRHEGAPDTAVSAVVPPL